MIDKLIKLVRSGFKKITDTRSSNISYELQNQLSLAFAMFSLKDASLSLFRKRFRIVNVYLFNNCDEPMNRQFVITQTKWKRPNNINVNFFVI